MERLRIGVTTAFRGKATIGLRSAPVSVPEEVDYVTKTIRQLRREGGVGTTEIHLFPTAPGIHVEGADVVHPTDEPLNMVQNSDRLVRTLGEMDEPFLQCQDDLQLCRRATQRMLHLARQMQDHPNAGILSFYTPWSTKPLPWRIVKYPPSTVYGTLCNLWNPDAAIEFVDGWHHQKREAVGGTGPTGMKGWDLMVKRWLMWSQRFTAYRHVPCLVQHTGQVSSSGKRLGQRRTMNFAGAGVDAMSQKPDWS